MATAKKTTEPVKMTPAQMKKKIEDLEEQLRVLKEDSCHCYMCGKTKKRDKFYVSTDPMISSGKTPICSDCARKIALRVDKNGDEHEPTKDSVILALKYLNKPFLNNVWDASMQESDNLVAGKTKSNVWAAYIKNIAMVNYIGLTYFDSDFFKEKIIYEDEKTPEDVVRGRENQDTYSDFLKNKSDVVRLLSYDPFEKEAISDQPFLYSQLLGLLDSSEDANEDMMRTSSAISIVRGFLQQSKIYDSIAKLMSLLDMNKQYYVVDQLRTETISGGTDAEKVEDFKNYLSNPHIDTVKLETPIDNGNIGLAIRRDVVIDGKGKTLRRVFLYAGESRKGKH